MLRTQGPMQFDDAPQPQAPPLSRRTRLALALGALVAIAVALARWLLFLNSAAHSIAGRYDFSSYYAAALALRGDPHADIYSASVLAQAGAASHVLVQPPLPYTYPPLFAILLAPFTLLSFRVLSRIWLFGNAALWLAITLLLAIELYRLLPRLAGTREAAIGIRGRLVALADDPLPLVALAAAAWLSLPSAPAVQTLAVGQINFVVLAALVLVPPLLRRGRDSWAGAAVGLAAMLKLTPALLIGYFVVRPRWRAVGGALVSLVALAAGSMLVVGPGVFFAAFPQALRVGGGDATLGHNEALFAPVLALLDNVVPAQIAARVLTLALVTGLGFVLWRGRRNGDSTSSDLSPAKDGWAGESAAYGIALCALLLASPTAWVHHYVWVLPAAATALGLGLAATLAAASVPARIRALALLGVAVAASVALGYGLPFAWDTEPHPAVTTVGGLPLRPLLLEARPLATLALALLLCYWYLQTGPRDAAAAHSTEEQA